MTLSPSSQKLLTKYLLTLNTNQQHQEKARQTYSANTYFQLETVYSRLDKFKKGYLIPSDFVEFMLENDVVTTEEQGYLIFRDFDSKRLGRVRLEQFRIEMLPKQNTKLKKEVEQRKKYDIVARLNVQLEFQLGKYFKTKLEGFKERRRISDQIISSENFSSLQAFQLLSQGQSKIQGIQSIDKVLRKNGISTKNQDLKRILSSLTFNKQLPLNLLTFQSHFDPFKHGFYPAYKVQLADKIQQKSKYFQVINARDLLNKQKQQNDIEASRLYNDYNIIRNDNLYKSQRMLDQSRQQMYYEQQKINNLRMSRQIDREGLYINQLARWRSQLLMQEQNMVRSRRIYDYY